MSNPQAKNGSILYVFVILDLPPCLSPLQQCQMSQWAAMTLAYRAVPCLYACRGHAGEESRGWLNAFDQDKGTRKQRPSATARTDSQATSSLRSYASNTLSLGTNTHHNHSTSQTHTVCTFAYAASGPWSSPFHHPSYVNSKKEACVRDGGEQAAAAAQPEPVHFRPLYPNTHPPPAGDGGRLGTCYDDDAFFHPGVHR